MSITLPITIKAQQIVLLILSNRYFRLVVVALVDVVDHDLAAILPCIRAAFLAATNAANVLVCIPHLISADTAIGTLNKNATASSLVTPTIPSLRGCDNIAAAAH
jgi:hypothetical protein